VSEFLDASDRLSDPATDPDFGRKAKYLYNQTLDRYCMQAGRSLEEGDADLRDEFEEAETGYPSDDQALANLESVQLADYAEAVGVDYEEAMNDLREALDRFGEDGIDDVVKAAIRQKQRLGNVTM